jgi:aspartate carbamoyltransferase catalytic subunit
MVVVVVIVVVVMMVVIVVVVMVVVHEGAHVVLDVDIGLVLRLQQERHGVCLTIVCSPHQGRLAILQRGAEIEGQDGAWG